MNLKRLGLIGTQDLGQDCCCFKGSGMMHPGTEGTSQLVLFCQYKVAPEANETLEALQGMCDGSIRGCEIAIKHTRLFTSCFTHFPLSPDHVSKMCMLILL